MRDLRLLGPACAAWASAWIAVGAPDASVDPALPATMTWVAAGAVLVVVLTLGVVGARSVGRPAGSSARRSRDAATGVAATMLVVLGCAALASTSAALALEARERSPLTEVAASHRIVEVVIEVTSPPRPMRAAVWSDETPLLRVDGVLVTVDGLPVDAVPVTTALSASEAGEWGARLAFPARAQALPAAEPSAFRLAAAVAAECRRRVREPMAELSCPVSRSATRRRSAPTSTRR